MDTVMNVTRILLSIIALSMLSAPAAFACDEACERAKLAEKKVSFPGYVTWSYCEDIRDEFMTTTMRSVGTYVTEKLDIKYKGSVRNTRQFLADRVEWVKECDSYLQATNQDPIFDTKKKTEQIYAQVDAVIKEFDSILDGVTTSPGAAGEDAIIVDKYKTLFKTVDDHRNLLHLRGRYVYR